MFNFVQQSVNHKFIYASKVLIEQNLLTMQHLPSANFETNYCIAEIKVLLSDILEEKLRIVVFFFNFVRTEKTIITFKLKNLTAFYFLCYFVVAFCS